MVNVKLIAPAGVGGIVQTAQGNTYTIGADGSVTVLGTEVAALLGAGFIWANAISMQYGVGSPLPADLVSVVAAATPANGNPTIAAQPPHPRKLQYRIVIGTPGTTNITAGTVTTVGTDQDGNAISETISLVAAASTTIKSAHAWASITSFTIANYAASGSGTGNTFGVGVSNDFGVTGGANAVDLVVTKATKVTKVLGTSNTAADDVASTVTVDPVARTIAPTTAPAANGLVDYDWNYTFVLPA